MLELAESNAPIAGTLELSDDRFPDTGNYYDSYTFQGITNQRVLISMASRKINSYLILLDSDGTILAEANNSTNRNQSAFIDYNLSANGVYTIQVYTNSQATGTYQLSVRTPITLTLNQQSIPQAFVISDVIQSRFSNYYEFAGRAGQQVIISMSGGASDDPHLTLFDVDGNKLAEDDDSGGNQDARIVFILPMSGTYTVKASFQNDVGEGAANSMWITVNDSQSASNTARFYCDKQSDVPMTIARRRDGNIMPLIEWTDEWLSLLQGYSIVDFDPIHQTSIGTTSPETACRVISRRLEILDSTFERWYITSSVLNGQPVVCAVPASQELEQCSVDSLIMKAPDEVAARELVGRLNLAFQRVAIAN